MILAGHQIHRRWGSMHHPAQFFLTFDTTGSSPVTMITIPATAGYSYFCELFLSSADVLSAAVEANECLSRSWGCFSYPPDKSLALRDSEIVLASSSAVVPVYTVSGSDILLQVDPIDGTARRHYCRAHIHPLPLERYPS